MEGSVTPYPFAYEEGEHVRRHAPSGWADYQKYRPWLRDEFCFRCVYCLNRERWVDMRRGFQIDHSVPQKLRPDLKADYGNLLYLCPSCNSMKSAHLLADPCDVALSSCIRFQRDGTVEFLNKEGERIVEVLGLDTPRLVDFRRCKIGALESLYQHDPILFVEEMSFPQDLPDLTEKHPSKNLKPEGVGNSWFALRERGELPEVY